MNKTLTVLGCGNMANAIVRPLALNFPEISINTYTPSFTRAKELANDVNGNAYQKLEDLPSTDFYLIACKPQQFEELSENLKKFINPNGIVISLLAGTSLETLKLGLGVSRLVRVMPNTPNLIGAGVNALTFSSEVSKDDRSLVQSFFASSSKVFLFESEDEIDIITGFTGSGPAYIFELARIQIAKMIEMGIDPETATQMIKHTIYGSAKLLVESQDNPETLRNNVTSKKGVTFEALEVLKNHKLEDAFSKAIDAAYNRSKELSK